MHTPSPEFLATIVKKTGLTVDEMRNLAPDALRDLIEQRHGGEPMRIVSTEEYLQTTTERPAGSSQNFLARLRQWLADRH